MSPSGNRDIFMTNYLMDEMDPVYAFFFGLLWFFVYHSTTYSITCGPFRLKGVSLKALPSIIQTFNCILHLHFCRTPQPYQLITGCVNPTPTTRGATTLAFTAHASQTTRPTCSAATTTTQHSNTAATRVSSRWSCSWTSLPLQTDMHTSESRQPTVIVF